jgi:hypothetical protein
MQYIVYRYLYKRQAIIVVGRSLLPVNFVFVKIFLLVG